MADQTILAAAITLLSKKEYSTSELLAKLNKKFEQRPDDVAEVIVECQRQKYVDDARYALAFVRKRQRTTGRPAWVVEKELQQRGVSATDIAAALAAADWSDVLVAQGYLATKRALWGRLAAAEQIIKQKKLLQQHGFSWEVIAQAVKR